MQLFYARNNKQHYVMFLEQKLVIHSVTNLFPLLFNAPREPSEDSIPGQSAGNFSFTIHFYSVGAPLPHSIVMSSI